MKTRQKKFIFYLSTFAVITAMLLFIAFLSYSSVSDKIDQKLLSYETSIKNVAQMENTLYNQSFIISQLISELDSPGVTAFQSYTNEFKKFCREEYDRTSTVEEISYVFKINDDYSNFIDSYAEFQSANYNINNSDEARNSYLYYRLTLSPKIASVFNSVQAYKDYLYAANRAAEVELTDNLNKYVAIFVIFFFILCLATFILARLILKKQLTPLYTLIREQKNFEKDKSAFFSTISHEFKTPLTSIVMGSDLLLNPAIGPLNEDQNNLVSTIKEDSFILTNLVNNLLQLSKIETADTVYLFTHADIKDIIKQSMNQFTHRAEQRNIRLELDCPDNIPPVNVDQDKILWVVNNLLSNAFKYSDDNDSVIIKVEQVSDYISVSVSDEGIGIPPQYSEKIFEKYFRINEGDRELGGTGLGLAIAKEIITAHGGDIRFTANVPKGSIFTFTIPLLKQISLV